MKSGIERDGFSRTKKNSTLSWVSPCFSKSFVSSTEFSPRAVILLVSVKRCSRDNNMALRFAGNGLWACIIGPIIWRLYTNRKNQLGNLFCNTCANKHNFIYFSQTSTIFVSFKRINLHFLRSTQVIKIIKSRILRTLNFFHISTMISILVCEIDGKSMGISKKILHNR